MDIETAKLAREAVRALNALICAGERHPNIVEADYLVNSWAERFQTDGEWNIPAPPMIGTDGAGLLTCPDCGGHAFKENGSHPCDWDYYDQNAGEKVLILHGEFEWYDGTTDGFECEGCGFVGDLPDDWTTDYAG